MDEAGPAFSNVYDDDARARAYAALEYPGTYYLAYRDLPAIIAAHVSGREALDFGCGAGRSTRFLQRLGFRATGIDISASMIRLARSADPDGAYHQVADGDFGPLGDRRFDLVLSAFAFDNIPSTGRRRDLLGGLAGLLARGGRIVLLGSTPEIYWHEWASFTTRDFPENRAAKSGERVHIIMKDVTDRRPVVDCIWFHEDYLATFAVADLHLVAQHRPLGRGDEGREWVSETTVAPWVIYVLEPGTSGAPGRRAADSGHVTLDEGTVPKVAATAPVQTDIRLAALPVGQQFRARSEHVPRAKEPCDCRPRP